MRLRGLVGSLLAGGLLEAFEALKKALKRSGSSGELIEDFDNRQVPYSHLPLG